MAADLILSSVQEMMSSASRIPCDIKFKFKEQGDDVKITQEVRAHKFILAVVSDVFQKEFYGGMRDDGSVNIQDASRESFEAMINFIYNVKTDLNEFKIEILCSLYYLAEKYNINALKKEALSAINNKSIPASEVLSVGVLADLYSAHEELAETLQAAASQTLANEFEGDFNKIIQFFNEIDLVATPISTESLVQIMAELKNIKPKVCENCQSSPCLSGVGVSRQNFVPGAKISPVPGRGYPTALRLDSIYYELPDGYCAILLLLKSGRTHPVDLRPDSYLYNCKDE